MESHEIWMRFAAGQTPAEFMCQYQSRNPRRCAERYVSRLPGFYGLLRQRTWRDTFSQAAPPTREQVIGGLTAYLEETRAEWEAALAEKTEREQADWEAAERERTEREQAEWERAQQAHVDQALELANAALPSEEMPPPRGTVARGIGARGMGARAEYPGRTAPRQSSRRNRCFHGETRCIRSPARTGRCARAHRGAERCARGYFRCRANNNTGDGILKMPRCSATAGCRACGRAWPISPTSTRAAMPNAPR